MPCILNVVRVCHHILRVRSTLIVTGDIIQIPLSTCLCYCYLCDYRDINALGLVAVTGLEEDTTSHMCVSVCASYLPTLIAMQYLHPYSVVFISFYKCTSTPVFVFFFSRVLMCFLFTSKISWRCCCVVARDLGNTHLCKSKGPVHSLHVLGSYCSRNNRYTRRRTHH